MNGILSMVFEYIVKKKILLEMDLYIVIKGYNKVSFIIVICYF